MQTQQRSSNRFLFLRQCVFGTHAVFLSVVTEVFFEWCQRSSNSFCKQASGSNKQLSLQKYEEIGSGLAEMDAFLAAAARGAFAMFVDPSADPTLQQPQDPNMLSQAPQQDQMVMVMGATSKSAPSTPWHQPSPLPPPPAPWHQPSPGPAPSASSSSQAAPMHFGFEIIDEAAGDIPTDIIDAAAGENPTDVIDAAAGENPTDQWQEWHWTEREWRQWWDNLQETRLAHEHNIRWQDRGAPPGAATGRRFKGQVWRANSERYGNRGGRWSAWYSVYYQALRRGASKQEAKAEADASW